MKESKMSITPQKDVLTPSSEKDTRNYDDADSTEDSILTKIKTIMDKNTDNHNNENIKYLINSIMEDVNHPLRNEIDKHLSCRNDLLDMTNDMRIDDKVRNIIQFLIRETALSKMSSCIYNHGVCKLYSSNEVLISKVKEYFIKSLLRDFNNMSGAKISPAAEFKMLEWIIDY
ncbi:SWPV1-185 [Shearwaterpox virus]|uniref:SWPV1-185 n=1 Tax=Shearwaterpox virus TaxID=1974596 RepID=A0A1V0S810_CNPV|nr:SWPV1-185 [Shearwaterpox virus]